MGMLLAGAVLLTMASAPIEAEGPAEQRVIRNIEYARAGEVRLLLDLYLPASAKGKLPVIVSIHGGGWHGGSKEQSVAFDFTKYGYAVASIEYRQIPQGTFPAQIQDCKAAVRWLRAHAREYGLNKRKFGSWGASAGGHLAALLGTSGGVAELEGSELGNARESSRVQAAVDFFGPIDVGGWYRGMGQTTAPLVGGPIAGNESRLAQADPRTFIDRKDPPFFIAHGDADKLVPVAQSRLLEAALRSAGVQSTFTLVPGAGHSVKQLNLDEQVRAFFDRWLK
jgi:acetyl esterase/lipase